MKRNILTMADINRDFTATVKQYLDKEYTFRVESMGGSQGEVAKVDLTNGAEVIRVLLDHMDVSESGGSGLVLIVGRVTETGEKYFSIWNHELEILSRRRYFEIDHEQQKYTAAKIVYDSIWAKRIAREKRRGNQYSKTVFADQTRAKAAVLPFVRRQKGLARVSIKQIDSVYYAVYGGEKSYHVCVKGRILELSARH